MKSICTLALLLAGAVAASGQEQPKDWMEQWKTATRQLIEVAEAMPAAKYDFKPTAEVETFGGQIKHAVLAMKVLLANAEGKTVKLAEAGLQPLRTKDEIVAALRQISDDGAAVISRVAGKTDGEAVQSQFFGQTTRRFLLMQAIAHNHNHYGQLVFYLRLNGITPPASRR